MTLRMTSLKRLTSKHGCRSLWVVLSVPLLTGCAAQKIVVRSQPGYVDLIVLTQRLPGWEQVSHYDRMLTQMGSSEGMERPLPLPASALTVLPALVLQARAAPAPLHQIDRAHLQHAAQIRMQAFAVRRATARQSEIEQARPAWEREALRQYQITVRKARLAYADTLERNALAQEAANVNLRLQERALIPLISAWQDSKPPPTPRLNAARAKLAAVQKAIANEKQANSLARQQAQTALSQTLLQASASRDAYVTDHVAQLTAKLLVQDMRETDLQNMRLQTQIATLLQEETVTLAEKVPRTGRVAALMLPESVGQAPLLPSTEGRIARMRLQNQRARWIAYLQDEAMAVALDAARVHHWTLSFRPAPGLPDLTSQIGQELSRN
jgi:flagellar biosynthesis GTPase FlhF